MILDSRYLILDSPPEFIPEQIRDQNDELGTGFPAVRNPSRPPLILWGGIERGEK
jgi:hypothetical protein